MKTKWIESNAYVLGVISIAHRGRLVVHSAFTNMEPSYLSQTPTIETVYAIDGYDSGLIRYVTTWEHGHRKETETTKYYIGIGVCDCSE